MNEEIKKALILAADALEIASDWNIPEVQINPPKEWNLGSINEDENEGWCSTYALSEKLRELADNG